MAGPWRGIALLLADRRQDTNLAIPDLENGFVGIAVVVPDLDAMQPFDGNLVHLVGDRVISISRQAVDAGPDHEVRSGFPSRTEQLVDVALAIGDVNTSPRLAEQLRRLLDVL